MFSSASNPAAGNENWCLKWNADLRNKEGGLIFLVLNQEDYLDAILIMCDMLIGWMGIWYKYENPT